MTFVSRLKMAAMVLAACGIAIAGAAALASKSAGTETQQDAAQLKATGRADGAYRCSRHRRSERGGRAMRSNRKPMTLEEAVDRSLDRYVIQWLLAEIPMARADVLVHFDTTASTSLTEASFQDKVRNQIDRVYKSFVNDGSGSGKAESCV